MKYNELTNTLVWFAEDMWLPFNESLNIVKRRTNEGLIRRNNLEAEFLKAIQDDNFDWKVLATESQLLMTPENYSNEEIKNYVKFLLHDYFFSEKIMADKDIEKLNGVVESILGEYKLNEGWMHSYDLFDKLKKQECFKNLEYYNLWKLPFVKKRILRKSIENKDREIGYLKYGESPI